MTRYFLPQWVHACFADDGVIFFDLRRDQYIGLDHDSTRTLHRVLSGSSSDDPECIELVEALRRGGLITTIADRADARLLQVAASTPLCLEQLIVYDEAPRVTCRQMINFVGSFLTVLAAIKLRSLEYVVNRQLRVRSATKFCADTNHARAVVRVFLHLRPLLYVAKDHCLLDSFVLAEFLRRNHIAASCVFGVRTLPFAAHCWVQIDKYLADGTPAKIAQYSRIFVA